VRNYDWVLLAGIVALTGVALWYQLRYHKLVDDVIYVLSNLPDCTNGKEED